MAQVRDHDRASVAEGDERTYGGELRRRYATGKGSWEWINAEELALARNQARGPWAEALSGVDYPWLCWNVDDQWCLVQQRMVRSVGWTPVVGFDPRVGPPPLVEGAILIDFNEGLDLPTMSMMFPLEFIFLFAPRLAFWHSDLLVREPVFRQLADDFRGLADGETAATDIRRGWWRRLIGHRGRYWELIGCNTRGASRAQYESGCGWWRRPTRHPNCPDEAERAARRRYMHDHGVGILIWEERAGGTVHPIPLRWVEEGHCSRVGNKRYQSRSPRDHRRDLSKDLSFNYDLNEVASQLGLSRFLTGPGVNERTET
ncbi:hypothetical protein ACN2MM_01075 [Alkalilimnicola ehrlichii MLHE-1]|uniref:Uncharacterized protein n=1 Tax=Alkalilimnicola ehrlichii (strain ATCC BAA-1101 / DSM 17681 / MLHE-1) TaxID=187272 RepID=Q0ACG1_ALKEH|nr:hypothetical protein [Alkalilimnicola ehrlichii]ABI55476.1 hypothetical protein Mlg_0121 [Alkalilimnicola ehrlichii MLHE-1]